PGDLSVADRTLCHYLVNKLAIGGWNDLAVIQSFQSFTQRLTDVVQIRLFQQMRTRFRGRNRSHVALSNKVPFVQQAKDRQLVIEPVQVPGTAVLYPDIPG